MEDLMEALFDALEDHVPTSETKKQIYRTLIPILEEQDEDLVDQLRKEHPVFNDAYLEYLGENEEEELEND